MNYERITAYDLETTGLSYKNNKITEVGAVSLDLRTSVLTSYSTLISGVKVPRVISRMTGINAQVCRNEGSKPLMQAISTLDGLFSNALIIGHNIKTFDNNFIRACSSIVIDNNNCFDTLEYSRKKKSVTGSKTLLKSRSKIKGHSLTACLQRARIKNPCNILRKRFPDYNHVCGPSCTSHRALYDAHASLCLFLTYRKYF